MTTTSPDIQALALAIHMWRADKMTECDGACIQDAKVVLPELNELGWFLVDGEAIDEERAESERRRKAISHLLDWKTEALKVLTEEQVSTVFDVLSQKGKL